MSLHVVIVGAGPSGCVLALLLAKLGCKIDIYDYRPDMRVQNEATSRQRSINLALSTRGLTALREAGVVDQIMKHATPMHGRCVHPILGDLAFHRYGQRGQYLLSVSRALLNRMLLDACDNADHITLHFQEKCVDVDLRTPSITTQRWPADGDESCGNAKVISANLVVGADGTFSRVRAAMAREDRFNFSQSYIPAAYKELTMTNRISNDPHSESQRFPNEWLHIWPRHRYMLIALPNSDGSFTCTLFMDKDHIDRLSEPELIRKFFADNFPDAIHTMPSLVEDFMNNPTPSLVTVRCDPYAFRGNAVIIGDAAHAIVPFYGQGCNAAFEDCRLLSDAIASHGLDNLQQALSNYSQSRKPDADAIADLALDHYEDMSSRTAKPFFVLKRKFEVAVNRVFPHSFMPLYTMISFSNIPYAAAIERAFRQDRKIEELITAAALAALTGGVLIALQRFGKK